MSTRDAGAATQIMGVDNKITQIIISVSCDNEPTHRPGSADALADMTAASERHPKIAQYIYRNVPMISMPGRPKNEEDLRHLSCMMDRHMPMATFTSAMH
jgi:hypothetical protein